MGEWFGLCVWIDFLIIAPKRQDDRPENLVERLVGLKELLPDGPRRHVETVSYIASTVVSTGWRWSKKALWIASTTAVILLVPASIEGDSEQELLAHEADMRARREQSRNVSTTGGETYMVVCHMFSDRAIPSLSFL